jgi:hypothetical protein
VTIRFTLYSRSYCHLCEDMLEALRAFMERAGQPFSVDVIDIDASAATDPSLLERFDELVPVLFGDDPAGTELCHYFLDEAALQRHLLSHSPTNRAF